jgi:hypothetical protein
MRGALPGAVAPRPIGKVVKMSVVMLFLHLFGLMLGAAGGIASRLVMRRAAGLPEEQAAPLRALGPALANLSAVGVGLLWLTGLALVWLRGGSAGLPMAFWIKMAFVAALTLAIGLIHHAYADIRRGDKAAAARLPVLGVIAGLSSVLAVLFAVIAFSG